VLEKRSEKRGRFSSWSDSNEKPVFTFVKGSTEKKKPNQPMILERTQRVK